MWHKQTLLSMTLNLESSGGKEYSQWLPQNWQLRGVTLEPEDTKPNDKALKASTLLWQNPGCALFLPLFAQFENGSSAYLPVFRILLFLHTFALINYKLYLAISYSWHHLTNLSINDVWCLEFLDKFLDVLRTTTVKH